MPSTDGRLLVVPVFDEVMQIYLYDRNDSPYGNSILYRKLFDNVWTSWQEIGGYGCRTISELASALALVTQSYFSMITLDMTKYGTASQFQNAFKEWYSGANQGTYCCMLSFHGQATLVGRVVSQLYGGFMIIGYPEYANSIIKLENGTWTFKSLN